MNRKEFLEKMGIGAAFALTATCLGACSKNNDLEPLGDVSLILDLKDASNAPLLKNGGYIINNRIVIARTDSGEYVAATERCSHEGTYAIILKNDEWFCTDHDARFDLVGKGLNSKGDKGLTVYNTSLNGDILTVSS